MRPSFFLNRAAFAVALLGVFATSTAATYPGFTEAHRVINLAAPEFALVSQLHVVAGQQVKLGDVVCELDKRSLKASLAIADKRRNARGQLNAAKARSRRQQTLLNQLEIAFNNGHARPDETAQARAEHEIAEADVLSATEQLQIAALEYERLKTELKRRDITSPINGTVIEIKTEVGELVTPADHTLMVLADLSQLKITLNVPVSDAASIKPGRVLEGHCGALPITTEVKRISPVADAASATRAVELVVDNSNAALVSGLACEIALPSATMAPDPAQ